MRKLMMAAVLALSTMAQADDIVYTWSHATTRIDDSAINVAERAYILHVSATDDFAVLTKNIGATGTTATADNLGYGTYYARIATVEAGRMSEWSETISTVIVAPPSPPGSLRGVVITVNVTIGTP